MNTYTIEMQINTAQSILTLVDGVAQEFDIKDYTFKSSKLSFDKRQGYRYYVSKEVQATSMLKAYEPFMKGLMIVTDAMAYYLFAARFC
jgi:hypothetical protein